MLIAAGSLAIISRTLLIARTLLLSTWPLLITSATGILILGPVTPIVGAVLVSLLVVVLSIPHHGGMGNDARAKADGEDGSCRSGDGCALTPRGFLRCRLERRGASCHGLVTRLVVGRRVRDGLQGRASKRIAGFLLGDGRHLCRVRLSRVDGQDFGLLRGLRARLGRIEVRSVSPAGFLLSSAMGTLLSAELFIIASQIRDDT